VNSQTTTKTANASIALSAPKPMSAIEPAAIPAPIAIPNSTKCQAIPPQASRRARRCSLARSVGTWTSKPRAGVSWIVGRLTMIKAYVESSVKRQLRTSLSTG
jgi:hypothetical protein